MRLVTGILVALVLLAQSPCPDGHSDEPPSTPPPLETNTSYGSLYDWAGPRDESPLGIGHLALDGREDKAAGRSGGHQCR